MNVRLVLAGLSLAVVGSVFLPSANISAASLQGLTVSPLRSELSVAPGTSDSGVLTVTNKSSQPMNVSLNAEEFKVIDQQYDYAFTKESAVAKWVTFERSDLSLKAGETSQVSYQLSAPLDAEPGGRYISLFASTDTGPSDGVVGSRQRIASLLYITVLGDVTRAGRLISLTSPWAVSGDNDWSVAIQNSGTTHFRSRYTVNVSNVFGQNVGIGSSGDALILPGTIRLISDNLPLPPFPGVYKYVYVIGLGDTPAVTETRLVLYIPIAAMIIGGLATIIVIGLFVRKLTHKA